MKIIHDQRLRKSALGVTGGYLAGYTHTLNPAIGCILGSTHCGRYCYAQHSMPARTQAEGLAWGEFLVLKDGFVEALEDDLLRAAARPIEHDHHISKLKIFFASSTEICAGPVLRTTRGCLLAFARAGAPVGRIVLQTRSPKVRELIDLILPLRHQLLVSFTMESDSDEAFVGANPPLMPRLAERRRAIEALVEAGVAVSITVSPCSRLVDPGAFAEWIARTADCAVVDTFEGDGQHGARTARTETPALYRALGWGDFRDQSAARGLFEALVPHLGERVGWGQDGFARLADLPLRRP
jgi:DNA repair photolyase